MTRLFDPVVNYVWAPERTSPINIAVARVVLGSYLLWKVLSLHWTAIEAWSVPVYQQHKPFLFPEETIPLLGVEQWILVATLIAFTLGYRTRLVSLVSALLISHMAGLRLPYNPSGGTEALFIATYFVLLFGLYSDQDHLSLDAVRRLADTSVAELDSYLQSTEGRTYRMSALRLWIVILGILYFGAGLQKILLNPGFSWTAPESLARYMSMNIFLDYHHRPVAEFLMSDPALLAATSWGTLVLELGLLVAALAGLSITPFVLGLIGLHIGIGLALGPYFFDNVVLLSLFVAYDSIISRFAWDRPIDVVYDGQCHRCMRSLFPFRSLDVNEMLTFYSYSDAPAEYQDRLEADVADDVYVFVNDEVYSGYRAFQELLARYGLLAPLALAMRLWPIKSVSKYVHSHDGPGRKRQSTPEKADEK